MLIDLRNLVDRYGLKMSGVIQIGAHHGQELPLYEDLGIKKVVCFEPLGSTFKILEENLSKVNFVEKLAYRIALGDFSGIVEMYVEDCNQKQSSSILEPAKHKDLYPDIIFDQRETVKVEMLDSYYKEKKFSEGYNTIVMDVQGFELQVMMGAKKVLEGIDYIYTEVNRDEIYKNCTLVEELDSFLKDFKRVETFWSGGTWGDALYIRKGLVDKNVQNIDLPADAQREDLKHPFFDENQVDNSIIIMDKIIDSPSEFQPIQQMIYPDHNKITFEQYFKEHYKVDPEIEFVYLDIMWTAYYCNHNFGEQAYLDKLQDFIDKLPRDKQYFTIVQYDDGIINDLSTIGDILIFVSGGMGCQASNCINIPIPLLSTPMNMIDGNFERDIKASFIGRMGTSVVRRLMAEVIGDDKNYVIDENIYGDAYSELLKKSVFGLAPRGYGKTSFRIQECLQHGAIPIYISDEFWTPYGIPFEKYGLRIPLDELPYLKERINKVSNKNIDKLRKEGEKIYTTLFNYQGCMAWIIDYLKKYSK